MKTANRVLGLVVAVALIATGCRSRVVVPTQVSESTGSGPCTAASMAVTSTHGGARITYPNG